LREFQRGLRLEEGKLVDLSGTVGSELDTDISESITIGEWGVLAKSKMAGRRDEVRRGRKSAERILTLHPGASASANRGGASRRPK